MFGIDLFDAALMPSLIVALLAGVISFLSPCVLPIVPPYLAYMGGISMAEMTDKKVSNKPAVIAAIFFAMG
ncbi:MAG: cytochrome c biogenesis protein CcdA, partial [Proteobacteria bacterium]|nr:cytochrome c biogenesis protein CcdA [Pseudomonadota bacterium]